MNTYVFSHEFVAAPFEIAPLGTSPTSISRTVRPPTETGPPWLKRREDSHAKIDTWCFHISWAKLGSYPDDRTTAKQNKELTADGVDELSEVVVIARVVGTIESEDEVVGAFGVVEVGRVVGVTEVVELDLVVDIVELVVVRACDSHWGMECLGLGLGGNGAEGVLAGFIVVGCSDVAAFLVVAWSKLAAFVVVDCMDLDDDAEELGSSMTCSEIPA
mmetsp:Transcript_43095/g.125419  ORF Transcript_43095/g.125419 Transcript_43095/m.125419 type:complete len:217 (+) Transcript_43095:797-1447(+)